MEQTSFVTDDFHICSLEFLLNEHVKEFFYIFAKQFCLFNKPSKRVTQNTVLVLIIHQKFHVCIPI